MNEIAKREKIWKEHPRWQGIVRPYSAKDVEALRGSVVVAHTLATLGAQRLWELLHTESFVAALGAMSGNQAIQQVQAGLKAIYVSGWQVAADANISGEMYPDLSLYPANSVPTLVHHINQAFERADHIAHAEGRTDTYWFAPIIADGEAGFGGALNVFELMKDMIIAGASAVHFEDQLSSAKKCGHMGGKVLVPTQEFIHKLIAARLAADVLDVPTLIIARTDALSAYLLTSDADPNDREFLEKERTPEGFFKTRGGIASAIHRGLSYAPYADLVWYETSKPDLKEAEQFASAIHAKYPKKLLAYNCSPSFHWKQHLNPKAISEFCPALGEMGYQFQFVTLAGFHTLNYSMFSLAKAYVSEGMSAYTQLQEDEFRAEKTGYEAVKHQRFVGTGYFDRVMEIVSSGTTDLHALQESTESEQFVS